MSLLDKFKEFAEETKELEKKTEELKKEIKKEPIAKPRKKREDTYQKQIDNLMKEFTSLREMITDHKTELIKEEQPVITALLNDIKARNIDDITEELMIITGLNKYDYYVGSNHFCAIMKNIKTVVDPKKEPEKYKLARFINRIYKGDRAMYRTLVKYLRDRDLAIINRLNGKRDDK